jgi:beta-glucosidase
MNTDEPFGSLCSPEHYDAARAIADEGIVLLKNDNDVLPVDLGSVKKIAVIGENAVKMMTVGGGSSSLKVQHECTPIEGLLAAVGDKAEVVYERGYVGDVTGTYNGVVTGQDLSESRSEAQLIADAVRVAESADVVLFFGGLNKAANQDCEDSDRFGLELPYAQDKVIEAISKVNDNLAVIIISGNAVAMPWVNDVNAIVEAWYSGSQAGHAIADVIFGKVNPSGKLPFTFPVKLNDNGAHALNAYDREDLSVEYKEGLYVGYRWADKFDVEPLFAFGHGLSYTEFSYGEAKCAKTSVRAGSDVKVSIDVTNSGKVAGKEVVQLYIGDEESYLERPVKELKGFKKINLEPGETKTVEFVIEPDMLKFFDDAKHDWVLEKGKFTAFVGASSKDIRSQVSFEVR